MTEQSVRLHLAASQVHNAEHLALRGAIENAIDGKTTSITNASGSVIAQVVPVPRTDQTAKLARVIAELMRSGALSAAQIGMPLEPGSVTGWNEQTERWLRNGT